MKRSREKDYAASSVSTESAEIPTLKHNEGTDTTHHSSLPAIVSFNEIGQEQKKSKKLRHRKKPTHGRSDNDQQMGEQGQFPTLDDQLKKPKRDYNYPAKKEKRRLRRILNGSNAMVSFIYTQIE